MIKAKKMFRIAVAVLMMVAFAMPSMAKDVKVNINTATLEQLTTLKYVGPAIAKRIIEYRKTNKFEKPEDILQVKGIGQKTFDANKDRIQV